MFPLIQANSYIREMGTSMYPHKPQALSCFQPHLATLSKNHKVIYFEHMGGFNDYKVARDFMNKMYDEHGNVIPDTVFAVRFENPEEYYGNNNEDEEE